MSSINVNLNELGSARFGRLAELAGAPRHEALGVLVCFWGESRKRSLEHGSKDDLLWCLPPRSTPHDSSWFDVLLQSGYIEHTGADYSIPDNAGTAARKARRQDIMRKATQASVAKRQKPSRPRAPKSTALAHNPQQQTDGSGTPVWQAYSEAYAARFGAAPPRSAKTASQCKMFAERMPKLDAPEVMRFYLQHPDRRYLHRMYNLDMALADAVGLHTQWKAQRVMTEDKATSVSQVDSYLHDRAAILRGEL